MTSQTKAIGLAALLAASAGPALAHHSVAMFDRANTVELTGTIKEFQWTNPHSWIQVEAPNAKGQLEEWSIEAGSPNTLSRQGWRPSTFKPGDRVTLRVGPMKDGSKGALFIGAKLADGKVLGQLAAAQTP